MVFQAALAAVYPNSSLKEYSMARPAWRTRYSVGSKLSSLKLSGIEISAAVSGILHAGKWWGELGALESASRPLLGFTLRGQTGALRLGVVLLRLRRPCGVSVPPRTSLKAAARNAAQTSSGPRQESTPWHLGAGPTRSLREG